MNFFNREAQAFKNAAIIYKGYITTSFIVKLSS